MPSDYSPSFIFQCILLPIWSLLGAYFALTLLMLNQLSEAGMGMYLRDVYPICSCTDCIHLHTIHLFVFSIDTVISGVFGVCALVCGFICLFYWRTLPKRRDVLYIRDELRISIPVFFMACIIGIALAIINELEFKSDTTMYIIFSLAALIVWIIAVPLVIIIMFLYPQWNIRKATKAEELILATQMDDGTTSKWETLSYVVLRRKDHRTSFSKYSAIT